MQYEHGIIETDEGETSATWHEAYSASLPLSSPPSDQLERMGRWLSSVPRDDMVVLRQTREFQDFLHAFDHLEHAHRGLISMNRSSMSIDEEAAFVEGQHHVHRLDLAEEHQHNQQHHQHPNQRHQDQTSEQHPRGAAHRQQQLQRIPRASAAMHLHIPHNFLQQLPADDVVLRVFEFLECKSLIRTSMTCTRFHQLAHRSASQRTQDVADARQLNNVMLLLRAKEQIDGVQISALHRHVPVPMLLLHRRIMVTNAGDPEYNGVYFCTGCNGNGFVFSKPRHPEHRVRRTPANTNRRGYLQRTASSGLMRAHAMADFVNIDPLVQAAMHAQAAVAADAALNAGFESEAERPGRLLRCLIAKRFSNDTILWYLSKEVEATETHGDIRAGEVTQRFSYWSKLMVIGDASPDVCRYPSQSSILARHNQGWRSLLRGRMARPPTVELFD